MRKQSNSWGPIVPLLGGVVGLGGLLAALMLNQRTPSVRMGLIPFDDQDVEAAARMLASENPRGPQELHVEQIYTQIRRAMNRGVKLYDQITAGSGYGEQGERAGRGSRRPVSTAKPATAELRARARAILEGAHPSRFAGATKFFEPIEQEHAFAIAETARSKKSVGLPLSEREERLLKYKRDADSVRKEWQREGARLLGSLGGVEFWS